MASSAGVKIGFMFMAQLKLQNIPARIPWFSILPLKHKRGNSVATEGNSAVRFFEFLCPAWAAAIRGTHNYGRIEPLSKSGNGPIFARLNAVETIPDRSDDGARVALERHAVSARSGQIVGRHGIISPCLRYQLPHCIPGYKG